MIFKKFDKTCKNGLQKERIFCALLYFILLFFVYITLAYNVLWDIFLIGVLLFCGYCLGRRLSIDTGFVSDILIKTGFGIGVIGCLMWLILAFGIGGKGIYCLLLFIPFFEWFICLIRKETDRKKFYNGLTKFKELIEGNKAVVIVGGLLLSIYTIYASVPVTVYDAGTEHIPIITYATERGQWYTNVIEGTVYADEMLLQHSICVIFASFNALKALTLFPMIIHFFVAAVLCIIGRKIYSRMSLLALVTVYLTTPVLFERATTLSVDMSAVLFWLLALSLIIDLNEKRARDHLALICFLCGCSLFAKYTTVCFIFVTGIIVIYLIIFGAWKTKNWKGIIPSFAKGFVALFAPAGIPALYIWYKVGNPFFPLYNGIFKSPYYIVENFVDPYVFFGKKLGFNWNSLISLVFHTNTNMDETYDGALGLYMLFVLIIPVGVLLVKNRKIFLWTVISAVMYQMSCFFSYNTRYLFGVLILIMPIVIVSITAICEKIYPKRGNLLVGGICFILLGFNLYVMSQHVVAPWDIIKDENLTAYANRKILAEIPEGKRVFSINDDMKGDYKGYFSSDVWYITYIYAGVDEGRIDFDSYITSFDYVLYDKYVEIPIYGGLWRESLQNLILNAGEQDSYLELYAEDERYILFRIDKNKTMFKESMFKDIILEKEYEMLSTSRENPHVELLDNQRRDGAYFISQSITNPYDDTIQAVWQISWADEKGNVIDVSSVPVEVLPGEQIYRSKLIPINKEAAVAYITILPDEGQVVTINSLKIEHGAIITDLIEELEQAVYARTFLLDADKWRIQKESAYY